MLARERSTHSGRLERWLGKEVVEQLSLSMKDWYGPPVAVAGVPGRVFAARGGDFRGRITTGYEATALGALESFGRRMKGAFRRAARKQMSQVNTGFSGLSDLIGEATVGGKRRQFIYNKTGPTGVINAASSLWQIGPTPAIGVVPAAAPGGLAPVSTTVGGFQFANPTGTDTQHFTVGYPLATLTNTMLLYDRIFHVAKTMASTATEAVTGVPTRYQGTTAGAEGSAEGNFLFVETGLTALAATAHNWTTCLYTDQAGNTAQTLPSMTGNSANIIHRLDHPLNSWFAPLATGDTGIVALTQMQSSASIATGTINFAIGHPIAWFPIPIVNVMMVVDGVNTAFNLTRVFDNACLAFLEVNKPAATATNYTGTFETVSG
jgi:hypothetical protein